VRPLARQLLWQGLLVTVLFALLASLGFWQLRRRAWKEALIARIESRAALAPVDAPAPVSWPSLRPEDYEFRHVRANGALLLDKVALVYAPAPPGGGQEPGFKALMPLRLPGGGSILVDRGFVVASKAASGSWRSAPVGPVTFEGRMRPPQARNPFTPTDAPTKGEWYSADPVKIAADLSVADAAPFILEQDPGGPQDGLFRTWGGAAEIPNNHLSYAATWFVLAAALVGIFGSYAYARLRSE
jgi:surfeit locus 1 family protein